VVYATNRNDADISNVTIGSLNNSSTCDILAPGSGSVPGRYSNYTSSVAGPNEMLGSTVNFSLTNACFVNNNGGTLFAFFQIYIDWNQDGDFGDTGEMVYQTASGGGVAANSTFTGSFVVPLTALIGTTRMRVVHCTFTNNNYNTSSNYAQFVEYNKGETEDYCFTVTAAVACSDIPNSGSAVISSASSCPGVNFTLSVSGLTAGIKNALTKAFEDIKRTLQEVFPAFKGTSDFFKQIGDVLAITLVPILGRLAGILIGTVSGAFQRVIYWVGAAKDFLMIFGNAIQAVWKLFTGDAEGAVDEVKQIFTSLLNFIKNIFKGIAAPFIGAINGIIDVWNGMVSKFSIKIPDWIPKALGGGKTYKLDPIDRINLANLAQGGIVMPSTGGTIARIGEAGRPERVEPLDPNGLSTRDKAMIDYLSAGAGGINITVNPSAGMDERELAALVSRQLAFQLRKGAA
jgi:hypothetical protein